MMNDEWGTMNDEPTMTTGFFPRSSIIYHHSSFPLNPEP
jgi:hypothetical protein